MLGLARFSSDRVVVRKFVFVSARLLTLLAIDAERSVVQQSLAHRNVSWWLRGRAERTGVEEGGGARWAATEWRLSGEAEFAKRQRIGARAHALKRGPGGLSRI